MEASWTKGETILIDKQNCHCHWPCSLIIIYLGRSEEEGCRIIIRGGVVTSQEKASCQDNQGQAKENCYKKEILS